MIQFDKSKPYNDLPLLPPKQEVESKKVLIKTISASRALGKLNGALSNLPNPNLFLDTIHLKEAKASSEIENIITTNDEIFKFLIAEKKHNGLDLRNYYFDLLAFFFSGGCKKQYCLSEVSLVLLGFLLTFLPMKKVRAMPARGKTKLFIKTTN